MRGLTVVVLAGCASHSGAYVEVKVTDSSVGTVALYLGQDTCTFQKSGSANNCPSIGPSDPNAPLLFGSAGGAWFRDNDVAYQTAVKGGVATFHLEAGSSDQTVELIAVGFAGDPEAKDARASGVLDGVVIPAGQAKEVQMTLAPALPVANDDATRAEPDGNYVLVWQAPTAATDCALAESWLGGTVTRKFVVPSDDADCDGLPTLDSTGRRNVQECDPLWFMRPMPVEQGHSDCATLVPQSTTGPGGTVDVCMLGGPSCLDGSGPDPTACTRMSSTYCLPQTVCKSSCAAPNASPIGPCVSNTLATTVSYHCSLSTNPDGTPCTASNPNPTTATLDFSTLFAGSMRTCEDLEFAADSLNNFQSGQLQLPNSNAMFQTQQMSSGQAGSCVWSLTWDGTPYAVDGDLWMLSDIAVSNGNHLVVPILFSRAQCISGAPTAFDCYAFFTSASDSMTSCAK